MQILDQFGFEPFLFFGQIVNFLILAVIFKKFLYKPILKTLKEREKKISKGLKDAEDASMALSNAADEKDKILTSASKEAEKILDDTKTASEKLRDEILSQAKIDANKIIVAAKKDMDTQLDEMEKRAKKASLDNSLMILEKVLDTLFTKEEKKKVLDKNMKSLTEYSKE